MMKTVVRAALALFAIGAIGAGLGFAFMPERLAVEFALSPTSVAGLGNLRADLGGCFIGLGIFTLLGLRRGESRWLDVPLVVMALFLGLRLLHLGLDGVSDAGLRSTLVEVVLLALLIQGRRVLAGPVEPTMLSQV